MTAIHASHYERRPELLTFIGAYRATHGYAPTIKEIGAGVGISSTSLVSYHLDRLERDGYLTRTRGRARTLQLTEKGA